jgi:hypothetical protein
MDPDSGRIYTPDEVEKLTARQRDGLVSISDQAAAKLLAGEAAVIADELKRARRRANKAAKAARKRNRQA